MRIARKRVSSRGAALHALELGLEVALHVAHLSEPSVQLLQQQLKMIKGIQEDQAQLLQQQQAQAARISEMEAELGELRLSVHGELGKCVTTEEVTAMLDAKTHEVSIPVGSR